MTRTHALLLPLALAVGCSGVDLSMIEDNAGQLDTAGPEADAMQAVSVRVDVLPPGGLTDRQGDPVEVAPHTFVAEVRSELQATLLPSVEASGFVTGYATTPYAPMATLPGESTPVLGTVRFVARRTVMGTSGRTEEDGFYLARTAPGTYELAVVPDDPAYPLFVQRDVPVDIDQELDIEIGSGQPVWGQITQASGSALAGVEVALESVDGTRGPSAWTDTQGRYTLYATPGEYRVRALGRDNGRDPVITTAAFVLDEAGAEVDVAYGSLDLISLSGRLVRSSGAGVGSSTVRLIGQDLSGYTGTDASVTVEIPTDGSGNFDARLVSGSYRVELLPPSETTLSAVSLGTVDITSAVDLGTVELPDFRPLTGVALDESGEPLVGATVRATEVGFDRRYVSTTTGEGGAFTLDVPVTDLDILLTPPGDRTDLAATRQRFTLGALADEEVLVAVAGRTLAGAITWDDGDRIEPLPFAVVQIYAENGESLGQTLTRGDGSYSLQVDLSAYE